MSTQETIADAKLARRAREDELARDILEECRVQLMLKFRFLDMALWRMENVPIRAGTRYPLTTDARRVAFDPPRVIARFEEGFDELIRDYLHMVMHCIFRHLWLRGGRDRTLWGLACDIAVENTLDSLNTPATTRPVGWLRQQAYQQLQRQCGLLAAGPIYRVLRECDEETLTRWLREFTCDDHRFWPADPDSPQAQMQGKQWEQLGRQTQLSMEESGRHAGENAGARALQAQVQASRSRRSYRDFLRRFAVWHEEPHLDPEEFDLGFYSYGLRVYGNLPLIEPLESREVKKIRDFVIVLDTSESTAGELVKAFLKETFTLLKSQDSFFRQCRILVLQADNAIQDETWLTDLDALDRYTARFTLHGGGGTDFRPAFARIAELREQGELRDLQGVLYFTDGKGIYPAHRPPFETAFLFLEDGAPPPEVPPWAMRLILQPEEFESIEQHDRKAPPKG